MRKKGARRLWPDCTSSWLDPPGIALELLDAASWFGSTGPRKILCVTMQRTSELSLCWYGETRRQDDTHTTWKIIQCMTIADFFIWNLVQIHAVVAFGSVKARLECGTSLRSRFFDRYSLAVVDHIGQYFIVPSIDAERETQHVSSGC